MDVMDPIFVPWWLAHTTRSGQAYSDTVQFMLTTSQEGGAGTPGTELNCSAQAKEEAV
jgi:hypothetical protein